ncbi:hypothetical protein ACMCNP_00585 [Candidatus Acidulodesulfobacterium sp. H_13]|uniref:hypothetical protein n=1 Tax=Candidatus Acidulodesulfobacterium sp. H_13 TaxID=3395470 RepID=UPI003AF637DF
MKAKTSAENRRKRLKAKSKLKSFQEFVDDTCAALSKRREIEELMGRVIILKSNDVLREIEIKDKNNKILMNKKDEVKTANANDMNMNSKQEDNEKKEKEEETLNTLRYAEDYE